MYRWIRQPAPGLLPGGSMHGIIEELCGYFIGAEYGIDIHYDYMTADADAYVLEDIVLGMGMRLQRNGW